ncbi:MAG: hypothetical protein ACKO0Y_07715, partial [Bacteroidota bacterium]
LGTGRALAGAKVFDAGTIIPAGGFLVVDAAAGMPALEPAGGSVFLTARMENVETDADEAEGPNYDKLAISREFDVLPKPIFIAMKEVMDDQLSVRMNDEK